MRMTLDIPEELLEEACRHLDVRSKNEAVVLSLQDILRRKRIEELKSLLGHVQLEIDLSSSRRRP
jgi:Arc/MetJ family transcription regulator